MRNPPQPPPSLFKHGTIKRGDGHGKVSYSLGSFIQYVRKIFRKTNISYLLIRARTCVYQGVSNVSFSEDFKYVLNERSLFF